MSDPAAVQFAPGWSLPGGPLPLHLALSGPSVDVTKTTPKLRLFLSKLATVHYELFDLPLMVTAGSDGMHAVNSRHYTGRAVDIRSLDKDRASNLLFLHVLNYLSASFKLAVFDERERPGQPHIHVEEAD
jgi:hypothetical protein